ncbi:MAG: hypothetical protein M3P06_12385 [Acidobacteriota bacterium]|nr:hypothetical protein [Acidobacteriota bacterium]
MPEAWMMNRDVPLERRLRAMMSLGDYAGPLNMPRGVSKFRSIEDLQADRRKYEQQRIAHIRAKNTPK